MNAGPDPQCVSRGGGGGNAPNLCLSTHHMHACRPPLRRWGVAAGIFTRRADEANTYGWPKEDQRFQVVVLAWVAMGLFGLTALIFLADVSGWSPPPLRGS